MAIAKPDSEILFRTWAQDQSLITDIVSTRVATRLPSNATLPFAVFNIMAEVPENLNGAPIFVASFSVDCFAGKYGSDGNKGSADFAKAYELGNSIVRCAFDFAPKKYSISGTDGVIYGFDPIEGPYRLDDTESDLARYNVTIGMIYGAAE